MKFENIRVYNFANAIRGMRNPKNSWDKSDTVEGICNFDELADIAKNHLKKWGNDNPDENDIVCACQDLVLYNDGKDHLEYISIGPEDMKLMNGLKTAGPEHRKYLRQIILTVDITAPLYWWKEFDTYKVGTVANSTSTMHKLTSKPITIDCFEIDDFNHSLKVYDKEPYNIDTVIDDVWEDIICACETLRKRYLETNDKKYWKELVRILPEGWLQTRTVTLNYENIYCMVHQRKDHKLNEWSGKDIPGLPNFIRFAAQLPYANQLLMDDMK